MSLDWSVNPHLGLTFYVGHAQGRAAVKAIHPRGVNGQFGYVELLYKF